MNIFLTEFWTVELLVHKAASHARPHYYLDLT